MAEPRTVVHTPFRNTVLLIRRHWSEVTGDWAGARTGRLLPPGLVFSACGNTLGRPGGAAAGASMARQSQDPALRRRSCGRLWNRQIRPQISSILIPVDGRPDVPLCSSPRPPARDALSLAAAVFCDPPTSPLCFVWGGASPAESCVRRAPLCFLLLPTIISFPSYQRRLLPPGLVFSACGNTLGRPGGAAAGASMAR